MRHRIIIGIMSLMITGTSLATTVSNYHPTLTSGATKKGECFTSSVAVVRPDAWRCTVGNEIYDPCFTTPAKNKLVCDIDPSKSKEGFFLELIKPLPAATDLIAAPTINVWMFKLMDGSTCTPFTGTMPIIETNSGTLVLKYGCHDPNLKNPKITVGILDDSLKIGSTWQAKKAYFIITETQKPRIIKVEAVNVDTVWQ